MQSCNPVVATKFDTIEGQHEAPFRANGKGLLTILLN